MQPQFDAFCRVFQHEKLLIKKYSFSGNELTLLCVTLRKA